VPPTDAFHMIFGGRAFFGYTVRPSGDVYWFANVASVDPARAPRATVPTSVWRERLLDLFADDAGPASDIVSASTDDLAAYPIFDMPAVPRWRSGPMVIVGDAAHATSPSSGQGAAMAMEDAVILAQCLRDVRDIETALATYEHLRRRRVERVVRYSARVGQTKAPGPIGRWIRDLCMPAALKLFASAQAQSWLYRHHIEWDDRVAPLADGAHA
jgi:FAD-dependent urate hydroxylase